MRPWGGGAPVFSDRSEAGRRLASAVSEMADDDSLVLGLPRGGVPVAYEVAEALDLQLDILVVRKLGVPWQPELAMGAIGEGDVIVMDHRVIDMAGVDDRALADVRRREGIELSRRCFQYRGGRRRPDLVDRTAIIVDDGLATGSTAHAACLVARALGARRVIVAVPVASPAAVERLRPVCDGVVALIAPQDLSAIGQYYADFSPTSDDEVLALLAGDHDAGPTMSQ